MSAAQKPLAGQIALVTGASRGIGRGIALQLGTAGATVYVTGRQKQADPSSRNNQPTLQDTANEVTNRGGRGIAVYCDHEDQKQVQQLFQQIAKEQNGQLDILVNNAYAAVATLMKTGGQKFFEQPIEIYDQVNNTGLRNHYVCAVLAAKLMVPRRKGFIVTVSSLGGLAYLFNVAYGIGKAACDRLAADTAMELKDFNVVSISLWPGAVRTETIQELVIDANGPNKAVFEKGESVEFSGKCIVALATDPKLMEKSGKILLTAQLAKEYNLRDEDGSQPDAGSYEKMSNLVDQINAVRKTGVLSSI